MYPVLAGQTSGLLVGQTSGLLVGQTSGLLAGANKWFACGANKWFACGANKWFACGANKWFACGGEQVVRLLVQAGYVIQNTLHLAGSVGPDTARKLSLKSACWYKQFWKCSVKAGYSTLKCLLVQAGSYVSAWLSRIFSNTVLVGTSRVISA